MAFEVWVTFTIAIGVILLAPGPSVLVIVSYSLAYGRQASFCLILAVVLGNAVAFIVTFVGFGWLSSKSADWVRGFQLIAGLYLLALAMRLFRADTARSVSEVSLVSFSIWKLICNTFLITVFSPTVVVFFITTIPSFVTLHRSIFSQFIALFLTVVFLSFLKGMAYTQFATWGKDLLKSPIVIQRCNVFSALLMFTAGIWAIYGGWVENNITI